MNADPFALLLDPSAALAAHAAQQRGKLDSFERRWAAAHAPCAQCERRAGLVPGQDMCKDCLVASLAPAQPVLPAEPPAPAPAPARPERTAVVPKRRREVVRDADDVARHLVAHRGRWLTAVQIGQAIGMPGRRVMHLLRRLLDEPTPRAQARRGVGKSATRYSAP